MANQNEAVKKFIRMSQSDMPRATLKEAVALAQALRDNFAGKDASSINLARALNRSPSSSTWRFLTGAAVAYGLTDNAYNATSISLAALGKQIVSPVEEGAENEGLLQAVLRSAIPRAFYEKYDGAKFPKDDIAKNVLHQLGVPQDRTDEALKIVIENAKFVGVIQDVGGSQYIQLRPAAAIQSSDTPPKRLHSISPNTVDTSRRFEITPGGLRPIIVMKGTFEIAISQELQDKALFDETASAALRKILNDAKDYANKYAPQNETPDSKEPGAS